MRFQANRRIDTIGRRDFIKTMAFGAVSAGFPTLLKAAEKDDRPNIILFITDDQGRFLESEEVLEEMKKLDQEKKERRKKERKSTDAAGAQQ